VEQNATGYPYQGTTYPNQGTTYPNQGTTYPNQGTTYPNQGAPGYYNNPNYPNYPPIWIHDFYHLILFENPKYSLSKCQIYLFT
jgi:hypothetical protein